MSRRVVEIPVPTLDERPRRPLTSREVSSMIGGLLGAAQGSGTTLEELRDAINWWAAHPEALQAMFGVSEAAARSSGSGGGSGAN